MVLVSIDIILVKAFLLKNVNSFLSGLFHLLIQYIQVYSYWVASSAVARPMEHPICMVIKARLTYFV